MLPLASGVLSRLKEMVQSNELFVGNRESLVRQQKTRE